MSVDHKNRAVALAFLIVLPVAFAASVTIVVDVFQVPSIYISMVSPVLAILLASISWKVLLLCGEQKMSKNQRIIFWSMFLNFCFSATFFLYIQGAFNHPSLGLNVLWAVMYLLVAALMYIFVKTKPETIDRWCSKKKEF